MLAKRLCAIKAVCEYDGRRATIRCRCVVAQQAGHVLKHFRRALVDWHGAGAQPGVDFLRDV
eukprot:497160-Prymnesium_polylepis.2